MGLQNNDSATYLTISNGKICRRVQQPTTTSVERITKENKTVNEEFYDCIVGRIVNIEVKDHKDYGKFWNVTIDDGEQKYILQFNYSSGYASSFLKQLPNVDFSQVVKIVPKISEYEGKKKTTVFINQFGAALKHYFTKDNPNGLPPLEKKKVKGKETWDDSEMMEFFENFVKEDILPKLKQTGKFQVVAETVTADDIETEEENDGDLPF